MPRRRLMPILFTSMLAWAAPQDLEPQRNWSVNPAPPALVFRPDNLRPGEDLRVEIHNPQPAQDDLAAWLAEQMQVLKFDPTLVKNCRIKLRGKREASCMTPSSEGDQYFYALVTDGGEYRFMRVVMVPRTLAVGRYLFSLKKVLDGAQAGHGRVPETASSAAAAVPAPVPRPDLAAADKGAQAGSERPDRAAQPHGDYVPPMAGLYLHLEYLVGVGGAVYPSYAGTR